MRNKNGVSLIVLMITIVVVIILLTITLSDSGNSADNTFITVFNSDLVQIREGVRSYYIQNDKIPTFDDDSDAYSKSQILGLIDGEINDFIEALTLNGDNIDDINTLAFYKIDLAKIGITKTSRGTRKNGEQNDVYVVSYPNFNVYYLQGVEISSKYYFSTISNISSNGEVINDNYTSITKSQGIQVRRESLSWTNKVNMYIDVDMEDGETLYLQIGNSTNKHELTVSTGKNTIYFSNDFYTYSNIATSTKYSLDSTLIDNDIEILKGMEKGSRYVTITKNDISGNVVEMLQVSFSNLDIENPLKVEDISFVSNYECNLLTLKVEDSVSGIKEVRYEYLTKVNLEGNVVEYYDGISEYDSSYMKEKAKKVKVSSDGIVEIYVPKDIASIQVGIVDEALNVVSFIENTLLELYVGIDNTTQSSINMLFLSTQNITSANFSYSVDGVNYTGDTNLVLSNKGTNFYTAYQYVPHEYLENNVSGKLYIKVVASTADLTETIVKEIDVTNLEISFATYTKVISPSDGNTLSIAIPAGFTPVTLNDKGEINGYVDYINWNNTYFNDERINEGVVIIDKLGNEFVWIPVDGVNVTYDKWSNIRLYVLK